ncbi:hypothetical protein NBRC10513_000056 [Rhodotorula toruloides]
MPTATARASVFYGLSIFAADLCAAAHAWRDIRAAVRVFDQVLLGLPFKRLVPARASLADLPCELVELCRHYTFAQAMCNAQRDFLDCVLGQDHYETRNCPLHDVEDGSESSDHEYRDDGRTHPFFLIVHLLRTEGCSCLSRDLKEYWTHDLGDNGNQATRQLLSAYQLEMRAEHLWDDDEDDEIYWNEQNLCEIAFDLPQDAKRRFERFLVDFDIPVVKLDHGKVGYTYVTDASAKGDVRGPPRFVPPNLAIFDWARRMQFSRPSDAQPTWHLYTNALSCD